MSASGETSNLSVDYINEVLAREVANPALGKLVLSAEQIRVNHYAESYRGERPMSELPEDDYEALQVCHVYNRLSPKVQYEATARLLNGQNPETSEQALAYGTVSDLLAATMRPAGNDKAPRATLAFEDNASGRWRERAWEVLWADPDYQKVRGDVQDALSEEIRQKAIWSRNLTALNIVAAISYGVYRTPVNR